MPPITISPLDPLIPIIVMLVKQSGFPSRWNALLALATYAIWTAISLSLNLRGVEGPLTYEVVLSAFVGAAVTGYVSYQLLFKGLLENQITDITSFVKPPVSDEVEGDGDLNGLDG